MLLEEERTPVARYPSDQLSVFARGEISKLLLGTYFSTPPLKSVMFSGVEADDGAKWIAACAADALAETGSVRVCLVDADLQSPTIHNIYSIPNGKGLSALLRGEGHDGTTVRVAENLWIVPAGTTSREVNFSADSFRKVASELLESCDCLVISAPDYENYLEIGAVGAAADGSVLVLDAEKTRRITAQQAKASLEAAKIRVLGSVLNNRNQPIPDLFYSHT
ncbi:MAG: hypothetical protein ACRD3F_13395 [Acidobacteriaceae bacterium]